MSNLARKIQQEQQQRMVQAPKKEKKVKVGISPGEKIIGIIFCAALSFGAVQIVANQATIYELNKENQETSSLIQSQIKTNNDLSMQVEELSNYERIWTKARELGLKLNENNVKVVREQ